MTATLLGTLGDIAFVLMWLGFLAACALVVACGRTWKERVFLLVWVGCIIAAAVVAYREDRANEERNMKLLHDDGR